jgi:hypothetical protein
MRQHQSREARVIVVAQRHVLSVTHSRTGLDACTGTIVRASLGPESIAASENADGGHPIYLRECGRCSRQDLTLRSQVGGNGASAGGKPDADALGIHAEETMLKSDLFPPEATKFLALPTETQNPAEITKM